MSYLFFVLGLLAFLFLIRRLDIVAKVKEAMRRISGAVAVMRAADVPEREKERALQQAATRMGIAFLDILARSAVALILPLACIYGGALAGLYSPDDAMRVAWDPYFLLFLTVFACVAWRFVR
jgi:hypothetical protein